MQKILTFAVFGSLIICQIQAMDIDPKTTLEKAIAERRSPETIRRIITACSINHNTTNPTKRNSQRDFVIDEGPNRREQLRQLAQICVAEEMEILKDNPAYSGQSQEEEQKYKSDLLALIEKCIDLDQARREETQNNK